MHPSARPIARRLRRLAVVPVAILAVLAMSSVASANVPLKKVSHDPFTNIVGGLYHQTQVEPDTFGWGSTIVSVFQTGRYSGGGSDDIGWATSMDAGATWTHGFMPGITAQSNPPGPYLRVSDPSVAYDPKHKVWLGFSLTVGQREHRDRRTGRPTVGSPGASRSSSPLPRRGQLRQDVGRLRHLVGQPQLRHVLHDVGQLRRRRHLMVSRSTDGGKTWTPATSLRHTAWAASPSRSRTATSSFPTWPNAGQIQSPGLDRRWQDLHRSVHGLGQTDHGVVGPADRAAPVGRGGRNGKVYLVWQDCRFRSGCASNDIVMSTSNNGTSWSAVVRIPIDGVGSTVDHFLPGIGVDRATAGGSAKLGLTYYYYPNTACTLRPASWTRASSAPPTAARRGRLRRRSSDRSACPGCRTRVGASSATTSRRRSWAGWLTR